MALKTYIINDNDIETSNENKLAYASEDGEPVLVRLNDEQLYPGGGGGGDFSTAKVTVVNNTNNGISANNIVSVDGDYMNVDTILFEGTHNITAVLYKNTARWIIKTGTVNATGSATVQTTQFGTTVTITGDCTITIS